MEEGKVIINECEREKERERELQQSWKNIKLNANKSEKRNLQKFITQKRNLRNYYSFIIFLQGNGINNIGEELKLISIFVCAGKLLFYGLFEL